MAYRHGAKRRETFYKVQKWNYKIAAWIDARKKTFDTLEEAQDYLGDSGKNAGARIVQYKDSKFVEVG